MSMHVFVRGLSVFCALAMIGSVAGTAMAQQVPVRVGQGTDGTLYVVQGSNSWTLVPDQFSDSDVAALNPGGEIDGTFPPELFVVQAPAAPPAAAPAPAPAAPSQNPGTDLTGKAASNVPGTPIKVGDTISSVLDQNTKPNDVFAIPLSAGVTYQLVFSVSLGPGRSIGIAILNPNSTQAAAGFAADAGCYNWSAPPIQCGFTPAASGTYNLKLNANGGSGYRYTFTVTQM